MTNGFEGQGFRGFAIRQAEELLAVKLPATMGSIKVDPAPSLMMGRARLVEEDSTAPFLNLQAERGQSPGVLAYLKENRVKEDTVTAHPTGGAEP